MLKRTPLLAAHQRLGGRLIEFGGWEMPVQYSSIVDEHLAVRRAGGLFDICHMGEVSVSGPGAPAFLNHLLTNDAARLAIGQGQYTLMCNERGGVVDDLYAYRLGEQDFLLIINASRISEDVAWLEKQHAASPERAQVQLCNISDQTGQDILSTLGSLLEQARYVNDRRERLRHAAVLARHRHPTTRAIVIMSQEHRTQMMNREAALARLIELLTRALKSVRVRKPTKTPKRAHAKRLDAKKRRSGVRKSRSSRHDDD